MGYIYSISATNIIIVENIGLNEVIKHNASSITAHIFEN